MVGPLLRFSFAICAEKKYAMLIFAETACNEKLQTTKCRRKDKMKAVRNCGNRTT